jgi:hypothetical protein
VIYPTLRWLTRFNSRPINADGYLIGWRGFLGLSQKRDWRMCAAALARSRTPALNTADPSRLSLWLAVPHGAPNLGRHAKDAPDAASAVVEISPPDVDKRRTLSRHGIAAEVVQLAVAPRSKFACCPPRHLLAVSAQAIGQDGETIVQDCRGQTPPLSTGWILPKGRPAYAEDALAGFRNEEA